MLLTLQWILKQQDGNARTGLMLVRLAPNGEMLWTRHWKFIFLKIRVNSWLELTVCELWLFTRFWIGLKIDGFFFSTRNWTESETGSHRQEKSGFLDVLQTQEKSRNKFMCRKALLYVLYMYILPQITLNLREIFDRVMYLSTKECFITLTLYKQNPIIPDLWIMRVSTEVYGNICFTMQCK